MKGDFSRVTCGESEHYSLVLMQQGRVQLDTDWNQQAIIQWHALQKMARDLIGEHAGPPGHFEIAKRTARGGSLVPNDFTIKEGRYYVQGVMCQNDKDSAYTEQEDYPLGVDDVLEGGKAYLVFLHVWLRHITGLVDGRLREVALGGADTTTRLKTVWQVKVKELAGTKVSKHLTKLASMERFKDMFKGIPKERTYGRLAAAVKADYKTFLGEIAVDPARERPKLEAIAVRPSETEEVCIVSPESRYRGAENQLYRVEIHRSGPGYTQGGSLPADQCATFKWSRENGSVVFPVAGVEGSIVTLEHLGRDSRFGLSPGDWVEMVDDDYELHHTTEDLLQVLEVDPDGMQVTLSGSPQGCNDLLKHPLLRRWDHTGEADLGGAMLVEVGAWIELEDGVQIRFTEPAGSGPIVCQSRDWWWIPARTVTGDVEWPREDNGDPIPQEALDHGHCYAPLALVELDPSGQIKELYHLRRTLIQLWE
jgi:hypothetical protein